MLLLLLLLVSSHQQEGREDLVVEAADVWTTRQETQRRGCTWCCLPAAAPLTVLHLCSSLSLTLLTTIYPAPSSLPFIPVYLSSYSPFVSAAHQYVASLVLTCPTLTLPQPHTCPGLLSSYAFTPSRPFSSTAAHYLRSSLPRHFLSTRAYTLFFYRIRNFYTVNDWTVITTTITKKIITTITTDRQLY